MRYEAMVNRQLNHAMAELERLQARRNGEGTTPDALAFLRNKAGKSFVSNESIKTKSEAKPIFARQTALLVTLRGRTVREFATRSARDFTTEGNHLAPDGVLRSSSAQGIALDAQIFTTLVMHRFPANSIDSCAIRAQNSLAFMGCRATGEVWRGC